jgi:fructose-bisphosphate aldolase class II
MNNKKYDKIEMLRRAKTGKWAIGQFNISNLEILKAVFGAAKKLQSPVIIGTSEKESEYMGLKQVASLIKIFREEYGVPAYLNLDHAKTFDYIKEAISAGYDLVHFDGSKLQIDENIKITKEIVRYAHDKNILVEGEVGFIGGSSDLWKKTPEIREEDLTVPQEADRFVKETGVDSLAVNIGTFHGMEIGKNSPAINLIRLKEINKKVGDRVFLVLHGGSGVSKEDIRKAIKTGIVKININTELRLAFASSLEQIFKQKKEGIAPYKFMPQAISAVQKVVEEKIKLFNSINKI